MYFIIALVVITSLVLFIQKVAMKRRLERGLGRKVSDEELTSFNAWMKVESAEEAAKGAVKVSSNNVPVSLQAGLVIVEVADPQIEFDELAFDFVDLVRFLKFFDSVRVCCAKE